MAVSPFNSLRVKPFVLISFLRSGTHLIRTALESHPNIACQTEVFNSDNPHLPYPLSLKTEEVLTKWAFKVPDENTTHAGFVLQAYHPNGLKAFPGIRQNPDWNNVWDILASMPDLKVIHLRRSNLLKRHLSHRKARHTGQWHNWKSERLSNVSFLETPTAQQIDRPANAHALTLDADNLAVDFADVSAWHDFAERKLGHLPSLKLTYEDLCSDFEAQCQKAQAFLGVQQQPLTSAVNKLETDKLSSSIANYQQLKDAFAHTQWAEFFED